MWRCERVLPAVCAAVTAAVVPAPAAADDDGYSKAANGLEWKDTREGTGPSPVSGALIRCYHSSLMLS
jgi:hypothetical protein